ncbi:MAG: magnesium transporter [Candidatus Fimisoma sp.]|nr:magnesium transporter [Bacillota bacterium]MDY4747217.1 magnesium transporter [Candidatus Fimisoma sp.]
MDPNIVMQPEAAVEESLEKIFGWIGEKKYFKVRDELLKYNEADIAEMFEEMLEDPGILESTVVIYRLLPKDISVEVFSYLPSDDQLKIVDGITDAELSYIVQELDFDDKIDILEELPANLVDKILEKTPKDERRLINTFLNYPDTCAGSLMTPDYISLQKEMTVAEAMAYIKKEGMDAETIYTCYVKDTGRKLIGIVSLSTLVVSDDNLKIMDIMHTDYVWINVYEDQEEVAEQFKKYGFLAIPVVDNEHRLVGIITVDDILEVIEEENTEDIERMAGIIDWEDSDKEYLDMSVWQHAINRLPWLLILMVAYIFTGMIITSFEAKLSEIICLVAYMPMLMGTGGNTGSQAATLIIRGLAMDEVEPSDALRILWKEVRIGAVIGLILSVFNFVRVCWFDGNGPMIALTVCCAMLFIVIFAKILGSMIPLLVKKVNLDPALIANPAISSISDAVALSIYFAMAAIFLGL